ncbi:MAG TPA: GNAT family N-acetyltransferase [Bryobacteraceae bacterium]|nr:GNAT family N-acetyltransferase [Bryobacteraceae bacterium]
MKSGVTICEMTMIDYDSVQDLIASTEGLTLRSADSREATDLYPKRNPGLSFAARSGGRLIGCVMWGHDGGRGYLQHLAVAPEARPRESRPPSWNDVLQLWRSWESKRLTLTF